MLPWGIENRVHRRRFRSRPLAKQIYQRLEILLASDKAEADEKASPFPPLRADWEGQRRMKILVSFPPLRAELYSWRF